MGTGVALPRSAKVKAAKAEQTRIAFTEQRLGDPRYREAVHATMLHVAETIGQARMGRNERPRPTRRPTRLRTCQARRPVERGQWDTRANPFHRCLTSPSIGPGSFGRPPFEPRRKSSAPICDVRFGA